ncbi:MAG: hypothetical protein KGJ06_04290 [Pseudomonadota bacterium]|nr:hypothetical protein [Pseudomonadota bacterium]
MSAEVKQRIEQSFGDIAKILRHIFPPEAHLFPAEDYNGLSKPSPYSMVVMGASPDEAIDVLKRLTAYVAGRPLMESENRFIDDSRSAEARVPPILFDYDRLDRIREFAAMKDALPALEQEGARFSSNPDEAAIALAAATKAPWHMTVVEQGGFRQLRLETVHPARHPAEAKRLLEEALHLPGHRVFADNKGHIFIPASNITEAHLSFLERASQNHALINAFTPQRTFEMGVGIY